jgi:hypothetical protein
VTPQPWFLVVGVLFILALLGGLLLLAIVGCAAARIGFHLVLQDQQSRPEPPVQAASRRVHWQPAVHQEYWGYGTPGPHTAPQVESDAVVDIVAVTRTPPRQRRRAQGFRELDLDR